MFKLTIVIGVVAGIALAAPDLVLLGIFLVVPGILLMLAPTVFVYLAAATSLRSILPLGTGVTGTTAAFIAAGLLGCLVPLPFQQMGVNEFQTAIKKDVGGNTPLQISGHILLERGDVRHWKRDEERSCDELCAALLLTPGVKSVTLAKGKDVKSVTNWRLVPHGSIPDTGLAPRNPEYVFQHYPPEKPHDFKEVEARRKALAAEWNMRLATRDTLLASETTPSPDMTITITDQRERSTPNIQRVEVRDQEGVALLRRSLVKHAVVGVPFSIGFNANMHGSNFHIGRNKLSTGERYQKFNAITELLRHVSGLRQEPSEDASQRVRQRLIAALDVTDTDSPDLALAGPWANSLGFRFLTDEDAILFRRIVADVRVQEIGQPMRNLHQKSAPIEYRPHLVKRIIDPETSVRDRGHFATLLSKMPAGTFANMTEQEWRIVNDPTLRKDAAPFVERLADLGKPGVQPLLEILQHVVTLRVWNERKPMIRAVRRGLARLGSDAGDALPVVREFFERKRSPIVNSSDDALYWRIAMVRMGMPIDELPFPPSWSEKKLRESQAAISRRIAEFDPDSHRG